MRSQSLVSDKDEEKILKIKIEIKKTERKILRKEFSQNLDKISCQDFTQKVHLT